MRPAIINVAFNVRYPTAQQRLIQTLEHHGFTGEKYLWTDAYPEESPRHHVVPYGFKTHAFVVARRHGHRVVLWCDAALVAMRDIRPLFDAIERQGHLLISLGLPCGQWCSDKALPLLGVTREEAWRIPSLTGSLMGLDFGHGRTREFFRRWHGLSVGADAFRAPWENDPHAAQGWSLWVPRSGFVSADPRVLGHRHDQTCASVIAHQLGMELTEARGLFAYGTPEEWGEHPPVFVNDRGHV